ncbi:splicing factor U2af large subunit A-like [Malus domestica]|uniref:splicing factor U2af large subunit A-like n=1 Tax=Malus domestica TaxID=3750 RepID=UPI0039762B1C
MKLNNNFLNSYTEIQEFDLRDSNHHSLKLWSEDDRDYDKHRSRDADEKRSSKDFDYHHHHHHHRLDRNSKREISCEPCDHKSRREQSSEPSNNGRDVSRDHCELSYKPKEEREGSRERSRHREAKRERSKEREESKFRRDWGFFFSRLQVRGSGEEDEDRGDERGAEGATGRASERWVVWERGCVSF